MCHSFIHAHFISVYGLAHFGISVFDIIKQNDPLKSALVTIRCK